MFSKENITNVVFDVIEDFNSTVSENKKIQLDIETRLYGKNGVLDSLGLVNFIIAVEQKVEDEFDKSISLSDEKAMSAKHSPFRSINSLVEYLEIELNNES